MKEIIIQWVLKNCLFAKQKDYMDIEKMLGRVYEYAIAKDAQSLPTVRL